ncbi:hypothetical protein BDN70DRAFT_782905, partial [Pholiota conissans]
DNRTKWGIIRSCLFTIFACTWTAIHPNIGAPTDSQWIIFRRRLSVMLCALIAPEVMVLWAMKQRQGAKRIVEKYNTDIAKGGLLPWSMAHGFFLQMGGLLLYKDGLPTQVLDYNHLKKLIDAKEIDIPLLSKAEIEDRSKGDIIVKGLVVIQTLGFVVQSIARLVAGLPLIELEVITLAFAMLNGITYFLWWDKPQNIGVAMRIPFKEQTEKRTDSRQNSRDEKSAESDAFPQERRDSTRSDDSKYSGRSSFCVSFYASPIDVTPEETIFGDIALRREGSSDTLRKDPTDFIQKPIVFTRAINCPKQLNFWHRKMSKDFNNAEVTGGAKLEDGEHRVPTFYAATDVRDGILALSAIIATAFGLIHFLAWATAFSSFIEKVLWRVTTVFITVEPVVFMMTNTSWEPAIFKQWPSVDRVVTGLAMFGMPLYIVARLVLLLLAFSSLRDLPPTAYETIEWTGIIPHL